MNEQGEQILRGLQVVAHEERLQRAKPTPRWARPCWP
jgi:hypothetical protein